MSIVMPAEWEKHSATWISWPKNTEDWPGKFEPIRWVYAEIVRVLSASEHVEILCVTDELAQEASRCLHQHHVPSDAFRLHLCETNRGWLRDSAPTCVKQDGAAQWVRWAFNAWAKYDDFQLDHNIPQLVSHLSGIAIINALRPDNHQPLVLEGGAIESDGQGSLLVTEECLLSTIQERNPGLSRDGYEKAFFEYLGVTNTIWLPGGIVGDDTHGHIDDVARFAAPATVALAYEDDPAQDNHPISERNLQVLQASVDAQGRRLTVVKLPFPKPVYFSGQRLPASYLNFYVANSAVLVPTFNDPKDRLALSILAELFPKHEVVGISAVDLVLGLGTLHCLTQPQFA